MLSHRFYYLVKPFVPWSVRMGIRRHFARRKRIAHQKVWPIDESAGRPPAGWLGWPEGKKFAVVLTHDVEGPAGLAKCRQLAELEMKLGFRSAFNFIPEGPYQVPPALRSWLTDNGFEVGVHDLHHDGRLFNSRRGFAAKAKKINHYLREWNACGYRSGFMLRNLDWLHELDIQYDASTFDTDPFEPQSDGAGTIFPFWIPSTGGKLGQPSVPHRAATVNQPDRGYVELPYSLPQDSTLFLLLQEKSPEIWLRKLDWIAAHGGMALVNVHPDYMNFGDAQPSSKEYDAAFYTALLRHVSSWNRSQYWNPLPRELAGWYKDRYHLNENEPTSRAPAVSPDSSDSTETGSSLRGKRTAVLLYSHYPSDPRPRRAAEAMIEAGMEVDLFCVAENEKEPPEEVVHGVHVFRLPMARSRGSKWTYLWSYGRFLFASFWFLTRQGLRKKYDLVHVHNMPDVLVFSSLFPKLRGAKVLLDLHDPMPEVMMTIYGLGEDRFPIRMLKFLEKWSIGFADAVLTVNEACHKIFSARSCPASKVRVVMNSPDEEIFKYRAGSDPGPTAPAAGKRFVIMYHGSILERHGLDLAVIALAEIRRSYPQAELRIYGRETPFLRQAMQLVEDNGLKSAVHYLGPKSLDQIVEAIRDCDVGIIPNRRSLFTEINTPTRIFEYLSQGKPVIAPRAPGILDYFGSEDLFYFELGDAKDLAKAISQVIRLPEEVAETVRRGQAVYLNHCWSSERHRFLALVAKVLGTEPPLAKEPRAVEVSAGNTSS